MGLVEKLSEWLLRRERKAAGGQPGKSHGIAQTGTEGTAWQAANRGDRQKEASGEENQNVGQP